MRWKSAGVISLLILVLCTSSVFGFPQPGPSAGEIWRTILNIGTLGFLESSQNGLVSLMRILIFILVFALLYMAASAVPGR